MTDRELMQQALDALEKIGMGGDPRWADDVAPTLRARLAQPEQEPVAWWHDMGDVVDLNVSGRGIPLYFAPPQREWQGLTDEEKVVAYGMFEMMGAIGYTRAIEAKLKQKNA